MLFKTCSVFYKPVQSTIITYNGTDIYIQNATVINESLLDDTENIKFFGDYQGTL